MPNFVEYIGPNVSIGEHTYHGAIMAKTWLADQYIHIGKYCSISDGATLLAGGEHATDYITTFPFKDRFGLDLEDDESYKSRGNIVVGNDVWIAHGAIILSGVTIGDGAIIGAGAVVRKDVPPYAVVVGNPAHIIKVKFPPDVVEILVNEVKWWDWPTDEVKSVSPILMSGRVEELIEYSRRR